MSDLAKDIIPVNIEEEMKSSYLDYAMSVIVGQHYLRKRWVKTSAPSRTVRNGCRWQ